MSSAAEPCRACDGLGYVETAAQDSRVIHHEPCPDCGGPAPSVVEAPLIAALVAEYSDVLAKRGHWRLSAWGAPPPREQLIFDWGARAALVCVAARLGVTDLHAQAAEVMARGQEES